MAEGFAPRHLESEIVALGNRGDKVSAGQFMGDEAPPDWNEVVNGVCRRWTEEGRPKTIVRVPPMRGGSAGRVAVLIRALQSQGARVLDATGTGVEDKMRFLAALKAEKNRSHAESRFEVVVGIQRVMEGTDWPVCSRGLLCGNARLAQHGRPAAGPGDAAQEPGLPRTAAEPARLVFFVPCAGGAALPELSIDHSRHALLTCCFLADHEVGQEWIVLRKSAVESRTCWGRRAEPGRRGSGERRGGPARPGGARRGRISAGRRPRTNHQPGTRANAERCGATGHAGETRPAGKSRSGKSPWRFSPDKRTPKGRRCARRCGESLPDDFASARRSSRRWRNVRRRPQRVPGCNAPEVGGVGKRGTAGAWGDRRADAGIRSAVAGRTAETPDSGPDSRLGGWRTTDGQGSGPTLPPERFAIAPTKPGGGLDGALRRGLRGIEGASSLAQLLSERRDFRNKLDLTGVTEEQILAWADAYHERTGEWPGLESGIIQEAPGETWKALNHCLRLGSRSLLGGSSIAKLLEEKRGVRNLSNLPLLTEEQILAWSDEQFHRTGAWPKVKAEAVHGVPGETWSAINSSLERGARGLPGGSSLARLLAQHRGVRKPRQLPPLSEQRILEWADRHYENTGEWPNIASGSVGDCPVESWSGINCALERGHRGLARGSSLAQFLAKPRCA